MLRRPALMLSLSLALLAGPGAVGASAAEAPRMLGQTKVQGIQVCACSVAQFSDINTFLGNYRIPYDGVLTLTRFALGDTEIALGDGARVRTFHPTAAASATVASEGAEHSFFGKALSTAPPYYDRVPAHREDILGARFNVSGAFIGKTGAIFESTNAFDKAGIAPGDPAVGESFTTTAFEKHRVNVESLLERDEDRDGWGDLSQDLCLGSPIGNAACTGTLMGSSFDREHGTGSGGPLQLLVQKTLGGVSTAAPARGVVVRWRVLSGVPAMGFPMEYQLRVLGPSGGTALTTLRSSAIGTVAREQGADAGEISTFPTRLPIPAGGYIGLSTTSTSQPAGMVNPGGSTLSKLSDGPDGTVYASLPNSQTNEVAFDADVEPDLDGDGFGDVSQDLCATAASTQGACAPLPPPAVSAGPRISGLKASPKRFRVTRPAGAAKGTKLGTKLVLSLSAAATVAFAIEEKAACKASGKTKARRCPAKFKTLGTFSRRLPAGADAVSFSGKVKRGLLTPGPYRVSARATDAGGHTGPTAQAAFTVLP